MWNMIIPMLIIVASNSIYNICTKSTPSGVNTFASLAVTYFVAMVSAIVMYRVTSSGGTFVTELSKLNWTSYVLGISIVGLESGFLYAYRAGWQINSTQLVASIAVTCVLIIVGFLFYRETLTARQIVGMIVCVAGLILVSVK